jgi:hypothetical protein
MLSVSILIPVGFLVYATHVGGHDATYVRGHENYSLIIVIGALVAISRVAALAAYGRR